MRGKQWVVSAVEELEPAYWVLTPKLEPEPRNGMERVGLTPQLLETGSEGLGSQDYWEATVGWSKQLWPNTHCLELSCYIDDTPCNAP